MDVWIQPLQKEKGKNTNKKRKKPNGLCLSLVCICLLPYFYFLFPFSNNSVLRFLCLPVHVILFKNIFINSSGDSFGFKFCCWFVVWTLFVHGLIYTMDFLCCDNFRWKSFLDFFVDQLYESGVILFCSFGKSFWSIKLTYLILDCLCWASIIPIELKIELNFVWWNI